MQFAHIYYQFVAHFSFQVLLMAALPYNNNGIWFLNNAKHITQKKNCWLGVRYTTRIISWKPIFVDGSLICKYAKTGKVHQQRWIMVASQRPPIEIDGHSRKIDKYHKSMLWKVTKELNQHPCDPVSTKMLCCELKAALPFEILVPLNPKPMQQCKNNIVLWVIFHPLFYILAGIHFGKAKGSLIPTLSVVVGLLSYGSHLVRWLFWRRETTILPTVTLCLTMNCSLWNIISCDCGALELYLNVFKIPFFIY